MRRALVSLLALASCGPGSGLPQAALAAAAAPAYFVDLDSIVHVECADWDGSGFVAGGDLVVTAAHVVLARRGAPRCTVGGKAARIVLIDRRRDYALLAAPSVARHRPMPISCAGYLTGAEYYAFGFAQGRDFAMQPAIAAGPEERGYEDLAGRTFDGQSGGPIVGPDGKVAGLVNDGVPLAGGRGAGTGSRELADTVLCKAR